MGTLLETRGIDKSFAGVHALQGVSFALEAGEVHALVGENGAGKSTLIKIMTGAVEADGGELHIAGKIVARNHPSLARALGVAVVYQQPSLFPHLTVAENIALALESGGLWRRIDWRARRERAQALLERAGAAFSCERLAESLSMPEQQVVEIAKAIGAEARIVILDEPTASLSEPEVERLFRVIGDLRGRGVGVVYISHRLEELALIADRITVLRDGEVVATDAAAAMDRARLVQLMAGRVRDLPAAVMPAATLGEPMLEVRGLTCRALGVSNVSLTVRAGEIVGLAGLVGSGRTQFAECIFGLEPADGGEIRVAGAPLRARSPADAIAGGVGYVPEDRPRHGVVLDFPIAANISLAHLKQVTRAGFIDAAAETEQAQRLMAQLRVKAASPHQRTGALSGGNQQKVALARWLAAPDLKVLILDEPTQGVDVGAKAEIHALIRQLAARGLAILMISSELPEILAMAHRIVVMHAGRVAGELARAEATQPKLLALALGQSGEA
ncbi:MAG TPA: sugar ABC transporter ATP-binding protein [Terriglobales bacterium]|jgi:rhamnose transport system ATP-binding protein